MLSKAKFAEILLCLNGRLLLLVCLRGRPLVCSAGGMWEKRGRVLSLNLAHDIPADSLMLLVKKFQRNSAADSISLFTSSKFRENSADNRVTYEGSLTKVENSIRQEIECSVVV